MPFLGKSPTAGFASIVKDDLTPNGSTTAFTLSKQVANANDIAVFLGNVRQEPTDAYTVSGTTLTMSEAPATGLNFYVLHIAGTLESSVIPADNTISTAKLQSSAVTDAKIAGMAASKLTGALPAISGAALTGISSLNAPKHYAFRQLDSQYFTSSTTKLAFYSSGENFSSGITVDETNERFIPTVAGKYLVMYSIYVSHGGGTFTLSSQIRKNGGNKYPNAHLINYAGGFNQTLNGQAVLDMNGTTDYIDLTANHNGGGNATCSVHSFLFAMHINAS